MTNQLTKKWHFVPYQDLTATHWTRMFIQFVLSTHRLPSSIVSNYCTQFTSKFWRALCQQLEITVKLSTAHHLETNGQTERVNQELQQYLQNYFNYQQDSWVQWLSLAEFAANNAVFYSLKMMLFLLTKSSIQGLIWIFLNQQTIKRPRILPSICITFWSSCAPTC